MKNKTVARLLSVSLCLAMTAALTGCAAAEAGTIHTEGMTARQEEIVSEETQGDVQVGEVQNTPSASGSEEALKTIAGSALGSSEEVGEGELYKDESVYVIQNADGSVKKITVSDWLRNAGEKKVLSDTSCLKEIENVKGDETFAQKGDKLTWNTQEQDIYYTGTTDKSLPVSLKVTYKLDGKTIKPEDLAGKSGRLEMTLSYENHEKQKVTISGKEEEMYVPFAAVSAMMLDSDVFTNVEVENGNIISDGKRDIVVGMAFPGLVDDLNIDGIKAKIREDAGSEDLAEDANEKLDTFEIPDHVTLTADVKDFELSMIMTMYSADAVQRLGLQDIGEIDSMDDLDGVFDKLSDATDELKEGTKKLADGAKDLYNGTNQLDDGIASLGAGVDTYTAGVSSVAGGAKDLSNGLYQINNGAASLSNGANTLASGAATLANGVAAVPGALTGSLDSAINDNNQKIAALQASLGGTDMSAVLGGLGSAATTVGTEAMGCADTIGAFRQDATAFSALAQTYSEKAQAFGAAYAAYSADPSDENLGALLNAAAEMQSAATGAVQSAGATLGGSATAMASGYGQLATDAGGLCQSLSTMSAGMDATLNIVGLTGANTALQTVKSSIANNGDLKKLVEGANSLSSGAASLRDGAAALYNGTSSAYNGSITLAQGVDQLDNAGADLKSGVSTLQNGSRQLKDGALQLSDGADTLDDGMGTYKSEATDKLTGVIKEDLEELSDRMHAVSDLAESYNSFSGKSAAMNGCVRFICETAEIKAKD